jgi:hypothetical protein
MIDPSITERAVPRRITLKRERDLPAVLTAQGVNTLRTTWHGCND